MNIWARKWRNFKQTLPTGLSIIALVIFSFYALHLDAINGAKAVWPVWLFAASGVIAMGYFVYLTIRQPR